MFYCEFFEISKNIFFTEHLGTTASYSRSAVNTFIFRFGSRSGILSLFDDLWKKTNFFLTFDYNVLALNESLTFVSSLFIFSNKILMSLCEKKRFVSSVNMVGFSTFEAWCKSITYNRNNKTTFKSFVLFTFLLAHTSETDPASMWKLNSTYINFRMIGIHFLWD